MGNNGAEYTGPVTGEEGDHKLGGLGVAVLGVCEDVLVESFHGVFKSGELDHSVRNLSHPQRGEALVEPIDAFVGLDGLEALDGVVGEGAGVSCLHSDFKLKR